MALATTSSTVNASRAVGAPTRTRATLEEEMAEKTKAREALIGSKGMEKLLKQLGVDGAEPEVRSSANETHSYARMLN